MVKSNRKSQSKQNQQLKSQSTPEAETDIENRGSTDEEKIINLILKKHQQISDAISTGAAWEIWMQVELILLLREHGFQGAREVDYPNDHNKHLDLLIKKDNVRYAVELKVESATNAVREFLAKLKKDEEKLKGYNDQEQNVERLKEHEYRPAGKWVLSIAYSAEAKRSLRDEATASNKSGFYGEKESIGVSIIVVKN